MTKMPAFDGILNQEAMWAIRAVPALVGLARKWDWIARRVECGDPCQLCKAKCRYAADRVAEALASTGIVNAFLDVDALGALGARPDGARWRASVQHPRQHDRSVATAAVSGGLATSGDCRYFWLPDFARHHIVARARRRAISPAFPCSLAMGCSPMRYRPLSSSLDQAAPALLAKFNAEALFVDKGGAVSMTPGFPLLASSRQRAGTNLEVRPQKKWSGVQHPADEAGDFRRLNQTAIGNRTIRAMSGLGRRKRAGVAIA